MIDTFELKGFIDTTFHNNNINLQKSRRALIHILGDNNYAIVAADIFIYFLFQTIATPQELLDKYDGFIVRTARQIELAVGCTELMKSRGPMDILKKKGLIETHNHSYKGRLAYRVNFDPITFEEELKDAYKEVEKEIEANRQTHEDIEAMRKTSQQPIDIDWDIVNTLVDNPKENWKYLESKGIGYLDTFMMYHVDTYWKGAYKTDYKWSLGEFNTLSLYLTGKGKKKLFNDDLDKLKNAIETLDEVDWMKKAHTAKKIVKRYEGVGKFDKKNSTYC